jgi:hypothetical protein
VNFQFSGKIIFWHGPSPFYFLPVPEAECGAIKAIANLVTYGWGVIPVRARIGATEWTTSLIPKDGRYLVPIKVVVQKAENLGEGDEVTIDLAIEKRPPARPPVRGQPPP